jgi:hypothetical protein
MVAFQFRMDVGYPGATNRNHDATVEAQLINSTTPPTAYGIGVAMDAATGSIRPPVTADTAIYGLYVRPWPTQGFGVPPGSLNDPLGAATPPVSGIGNVLKRGYMTVKLQSTAAAVKGAPVQIWTGAAAGPHVPGGINADAAAAGSNVTLPNSYFMGAADANGITEIAVNI